MIGANLRGIDKNTVFKIVEFSIFIDESGPTPIYVYPETITEESQMDIAMKSISLLMGEGVYQSGFEFENLKYFGILPFPDIDMAGLTYFFLIRDEEARGKAKAATITILVDEDDSKVLYENIKTLRVLIDRTAAKLNARQSENEIKEIMETLKKELEDFDESDPVGQKLTREIKMVFTGLDKSGKTSFLKGVEQKYSELMGIAPTKGIERSKRDVLGAKLLEWDFGGQKNYRRNYFKNAELYLTDIDMLFFIIDVQDRKRVEEAESYLHQMLTTMDEFQEYPPVIVLFHKYDPDMQEDPEINNRIRNMQDHIKNTHPKWIIRFFKTTIFDHWSIVSAFSYGISQLSPNREVFRSHLKWITKKMGGAASILLTQNAIILSDYSDDWKKGKFFESSQANFYNLFIKLQDFGLLHSDRVMWKLNGISILLKKFMIEDKEFYVLLETKDAKRANRLDKYMDRFIKKIKPLMDHYL